MAPPITCQCGECQKCKHREYMRAWYRRPGVAQRQRDSAIASRERRIEYVKEYDRQRGHRNSPEQTRAHSLARVLEREPCEVCGAERADAHHEDYDKPLDVRWLCRKHHMELHRTVAP